MVLVESSNGTHWHSTSKARLWVQKSWVTGWSFFWTQHQHVGLSWHRHQDVAKSRCKASCSFCSFIHLWVKVRGYIFSGFGKYNLSPTWKTKCKLGRILIPYLSQNLWLYVWATELSPEGSQNHRTAEFGRDVPTSSNPSPVHRAWSPWMAQCHVQSASDKGLLLTHFPSPRNFNFSNLSNPHSIPLCETLKRSFWAHILSCPIATSWIWSKLEIQAVMNGTNQGPAVQNSPMSWFSLPESPWLLFTIP